MSEIRLLCNLSKPTKTWKKTPKKFCRKIAEEKCKKSGIGKRVDNLLLVTHEFLAFSQTVGLTLDIDDCSDGEHGRV